MVGSIRFIDRVKELKALNEYCSRFRATPLYIYGPEGCGKTRLLREFTRRFNDFFMDGVAVYVDALEDRDIRKALASSLPIDVLNIGLEASMDLLQQSIPLGQALSRSISLIIDKIAEKVFRKSLKDKYILITVDDVVRSIGLGKVEYYTKWLYEVMWRLEEEYKPKAINLIATTSEGVSLNLITRHRHVGVNFIWNLDKESFKELFYELKPPSNIYFEDVWRILGGNPGKLIELMGRYYWEIDKMVFDYVWRAKGIIKRIIEEGLREELAIAIEDPDSIMGKPTRNMAKVENILVEANMLIRVGIPLDYSEIKPDLEIGLGREYAWQTPLYREALRKALNNM